MTEPAPAYQPAPAASAPVPGKGLGIAALVAAFFINLLGLILGIVALNQSKKAGVKNTPAVVAIVLSIIFMVAWIVVFIFFGALFASLIGACSELGSGSYTSGSSTLTCG